MLSELSDVPDRPKHLVAVCPNTKKMQIAIDALEYLADRRHTLHMSSVDVSRVAQAALRRIQEEER